jgi:photosystem II stability/assembly factor-like uncharacterized protein
MPSLADTQPDIAVLVGTRKGLFIARSDDRRRHWQLEGPHIAGYEIQAAYLHPDDPAIGYAAAHHPVWGIHVYRTEDGGRSWTGLAEVPRHGPDEDESSLKMIWSLAPGPGGDPDHVMAGVEPPGVFRSRDGGQTWQPLTGFNDHPDRPAWSPAKGGLAVHSLQPDPFDSQRLFVAMSAGGIYRSDDGGDHWQAANAGIRAPYLAEQAPECGHCVHRLLVHPAQPGRAYQQSHHGLYVTDDGGRHWQEVTDGLPSDFGYALATDPRHADVIYCVPEESSQFRATVDGRLRVYRSDDAGRHWTALTRGLPQENVFVTVLRDGLAADGLDPLGLYLGTSSGHLFASRDAGDSWQRIAGYLPGILSIRAVAVDDGAS